MRCRRFLVALTLLIALPSLAPSRNNARAADLWQLAQQKRDIHRFSTLFPAQSLRDDLGTDDGIDAAIDCIRTIADGATGVDIVDDLIGGLVGDHVAEDDIALLVIQHTGR